MTNQENKIETISVEEQLADLNLQEADSADVKGGPIYMNYDGIKGNVSSSAAPAPQTREQVLLAK